MNSTLPLQSTSRDVLVLGLGNILLGDDGVGVHVVRQLALHPDAPTGLLAFDGGTLGFRLMDRFAKAEAILLVDAAQFDEPAGRIRLLERQALERHVCRGGRMSAHEAGLVDLLTLAMLESCMPERLALLGIQPHSIDWSDALSAPVADAVPAACRLAIDTVTRWQRAA